MIGAATRNTSVFRPTQMHQSSKASSSSTLRKGVLHASVHRRRQRRLTRSAIRASGCAIRGGKRAGRCGGTAHLRGGVGLFFDTFAAVNYFRRSLPSLAIASLLVLAACGKRDECAFGAVGAGSVLRVERRLPASPLVLSFAVHLGRHQPSGSGEGAKARQRALLGEGSREVSAGRRLRRAHLRVRPRKVRARHGRFPRLAERQGHPHPFVPNSFGDLVDLSDERDLRRGPQWMGPILQDGRRVRRRTRCRLLPFALPCGRRRQTESAEGRSGLGRGVQEGTSGVDPALHQRRWMPRARAPLPSEQVRDRLRRRSRLPKRTP